MSHRGTSLGLARPTLTCLLASLLHMWTCQLQKINLLPIGWKGLTITTTTNKSKIKTRISNSHNTPTRSNRIEAYLWSYNKAGGSTFKPFNSLPHTYMDFSKFFNILKLPMKYSNCATLFNKHQIITFKSAI